MLKISQNENEKSGEICEFIFVLNLLFLSIDKGFRWKQAKLNPSLLSHLRPHL